LRDWVRTAIQTFAPFAAGSGPQAKDVFLPGQADPDSGVGRLLRELSVADLHHAASRETAA
jgi:hypothetical protein